MVELQTTAGEPDKLEEDKQRVEPEFHKGECDFECPICYEIMAEPVVTECNHGMCLSCFRKIIKGKKNPLCPYCRRSFNSMIIPRIDQELQQKIEFIAPDLFEERREALIESGEWDPGYYARTQIKNNADKYFHGLIDKAIQVLPSKHCDAIIKAIKDNDDKIWFGNFFQESSKNRILFKPWHEQNGVYYQGDTN